MKIKIKNIQHEQKVSQGGKNYTSCRITVWNKKEGKESILSGFGDGTTKTWNPGDMVEVDVSQTDKGYWNFKTNEESMPSENPIVVVLHEISAKLTVLMGDKTVPEKETIQAVAEEFGGTVVSEETDDHESPAKEEVRVEDIPF